jgi:hypothetical protein
VCISPIRAVVDGMKVRVASDAPTLSNAKGSAERLSVNADGAES